MSLYEELIRYSKRDVVPMHMPGHKRNPGFSMTDPYSFDITEVEEMDDLHDPKGVIRELMDRAKMYYKTPDTYLSVGGSTACNQIAIASCSRDKTGSVIVTDEVCHRSVFHTAKLLGLTCEMIPRKRIQGTQIPDAIEPEELDACLHTLRKRGIHPSVVVVTSPTYEGVVSDIRTIAGIVHRYDSILLVDEAHGAHFTPACGRAAGDTVNDNAPKRLLDWPVPAMRLGADLVTESLHKTLPSLTQTAVLHRCTDAVTDETVMEYHDIFITSSPSYVLMASIDQCIDWLIREGEECFAAYDERLARFYDIWDNKLFHGRKEYDPSRIVLTGDGSGIAAKLRARGIEPELVKQDHVVLISTVADDEEALKKVGESI